MCLGFPQGRQQTRPVDEQVSVQNLSHWSTSFTQFMGAKKMGWENDLHDIARKAHRTEWLAVIDTNIGRHSMHRLLGRRLYMVEVPEIKLNLKRYKSVCR